MYVGCATTPEDTYYLTLTHALCTGIISSNGVIGSLATDGQPAHGIQASHEKSASKDKAYACCELLPVPASGQCA